MNTQQSFVHLLCTLWQRKFHKKKAIENQKMQSLRDQKSSPVILDSSVHQSLNYQTMMYSHMHTNFWTV